MSAGHLLGLTIAVVVGILGPISALFFLSAAVFGWARLLMEWSARRTYAAKLASESGPYTKVEFFKVPNPTMLGVRCYKDDRIAIEMSGDKP